VLETVLRFSRFFSREWSEWGSGGRGITANCQSSEGN
jgi:hypothetical protein